MKRKVYYISLLLIFVFIFTACGQTAAPKVETKVENPAKPLQFKISLTNAPTDILTLGAQFIEKRVEELSNGTMDPTVHHSGELSGGNGNAEIEMTQQGTIQLHITTNAYLASIEETTSIFSLPFMFSSVDQMIKFVKSDSPVLQKIGQKLEAKNLKVIGWWPRAFRQLTNSKRPVEKLEDVQGLKVRVMNNPLYVDTMTAMKANPVPMAMGEVYNALQLKTIDGQENGETTTYARKLQEVQPYMTVWDYSTDIEIVLVNMQWWNGLTDKQREIIQKAVNESVDYEADLLNKSTEEARKKIADSGVKISVVGKAEKERFREAVQPVWKKYEGVFGKELMDEFIKEAAKYE